MSSCCIKSSRKKIATHTIEPSPTSINDGSNLNNDLNKYELGLLGISVSYLATRFISEVRAAGHDEKTAKIYEIEEDVIRHKGSNIYCPVDNIDGERRLGASYVHSLFEEEASNDDIAAVGQATIMLSYAWSYTVGDIIDTLLDYCRRRQTDDHKDCTDPRTTYVWICCLCVNQHRVIEARLSNEIVPFEEFREVFDGRVRNIGNVLAMMAPWHDPVYLTRVWCVFELYTACCFNHSKNEKKDEDDSDEGFSCKVTIGMPPKERHSFVNGLMNEDGSTANDQMNRLFKTLGSTDVRKAKASVETDRSNILRLIEEVEEKEEKGGDVGNGTNVGFDSFNATVSGLVRQWAIDVIMDEIKAGSSSITSHQQLKQHHENDDNDEEGTKRRKEKQGHLLNNVSDLFRQIGEIDLSLEIGNEALAVNESVYGRESTVTARSISLVGTATYYKGDYNDNDTSGSNSGGGSDNAGMAMKLQREALAIRERLLGRIHPDTADSIWWIARMLDFNDTATTTTAEGNDDNDQEEDEAMKMHREALSIFEKVFGRQHERTAESLYFIAIAVCKRGNLDEALTNLREVLEIQTKVFGKEHSSTANTMYHIAEILFDKGMMEESFRMYEEALPIFEKVMGSDDPGTLNTKQWIDILSGMCN